MKYLCLGYFEPAKLRMHPQDEIDRVMQQCQPHLERLYGSGQVILDAGLTTDSKCLRRRGGNIDVVDGPFVDAAAMIGSAFLIEADDIDHAIQVAMLHPTTQVAAGESLGWGIEVRPIHAFELDA